MDGFELFYRLGAALALGLLVGLERGWHGRDREEGHRVAGIRTFALLGLLGGVAGLLSEPPQHVLLATSFAALAAVMIAAHVVSQRAVPDVGITGVIAALLTFAFGAMAVLDLTALALAGAVVTAALLGIKPMLHRRVERMQEKELFATLKLLLISVVVLPLLPDQGFGPWEALNPYRIWWMVVLIAAISYTGYFAMKLFGERNGIMATGAFAGLASSTALTVNYSRLARNKGSSQDLLAAGILVAGATVFPRILVVTAIFNRELALGLLWPILAVTVVNYGAAYVFWHRDRRGEAAESIEIPNPFELRPALLFAVLLAIIMLLSRALSEQFGDAGVYLLAAVSGLADVDAITLSIASMTTDTLSVAAGTLGVLIAAFVNTLVKVFLALGIGGRALGLRVGLATAAVLPAGLAAWALIA